MFLLLYLSTLSTFLFWEIVLFTIASRSRSEVICSITNKKDNPVLGYVIAREWHMLETRGSVKNKIRNSLVEKRLFLIEKSNHFPLLWTELNPTMLKIFPIMYWMKSNHMMYKMKMVLQSVSYSLTNCCNCYSQLQSTCDSPDWLFVYHYYLLPDLWPTNWAPVLGLCLLDYTDCFPPRQNTPSHLRMQEKCIIVM